MLTLFHMDNGDGESLVATGSEVEVGEDMFFCMSFFAVFRPPRFFFVLCFYIIR
jgi:hypothetical protein